MDFHFRDDLDEPTYSSDFPYDLENGYINPHELLFDAEAARAVIDASNLLRDFFHQAQEAGVLEAM